MKLFHKLALGNVLGVAVLGLTLLGALHSIESTESELDRMMEQTLPITQAIQELKGSMLSVSSAVGEFLFLEYAGELADQEELAEDGVEDEEEQISEGRERYDDWLKVYHELALENAAESARSAELAELGRVYFEFSDQLVELAEDGEEPAELIELKEELEDAEIAFLAKSDAIINMHQGMI